MDDIFGSADSVITGISWQVFGRDIEKMNVLKEKLPLKAEWILRLRVRLPPGTEEVAFLTLGAELGGLMVGAAEAVTEGGTIERAEVEVIIAARD
jgi:hypothetical protein